MNWENQLALALQDHEKQLVPNALKARNLCRQKKYGKALEILWEVLRASRRSGEKTQEAFVLIHIGKVYRNWIWDIALKFFREGLEASKQSGFRHGEMIAYNAIGELYYTWGNQEKALSFYQKSLGAARSLHEQGIERDILLDMVECYGEYGDFERCDQLLQEALALDEELNTGATPKIGCTLSIVSDPASCNNSKP